MWKGKGLCFTSGKDDSYQNLTIHGEIPPWLCGSLYRVGPGLLEVSKDSRYKHWFDGLALLHRFTFDGNEVSYVSKFLDSNAYRTAVSKGRISVSEFGTFASPDPCESIFSRFFSYFRAPDLTDNANVNVTQFGGGLYALTETPVELECHPRTLGVIGRLDPRSLLDLTVIGTTTAHPHFEKSDGQVRMTNFISSFGPKCFYNIYTLTSPTSKSNTPTKNPSSSGNVRGELLCQVLTDRPGYIHSFALTPNYVVIVEYPYTTTVIRLLLAAINARSYIENFTWNQDQPARFLVVDRRLRRHTHTFSAPAFFSFHHVNAFEEEGYVNVDLVAFQDTSIIDAFYLDRARDESVGLPPSQLRRYRLPILPRSDELVPVHGHAEHTVLFPHTIELPRIHYDLYNGRPYRYVYAVGSLSSPGFIERLVKINVQTGESWTWSEKESYPSEPVFVPRPDCENEDDGIVLSLVLSAASSTSFLLVLDASTFKEKARVPLPQHVPLPLHGSFVPKE